MGWRHTISLTAFTHRIEFVPRCIELYGAERRIRILRMILSVLNLKREKKTNYVMINLYKNFNS